MKRFLALFTMASLLLAAGCKPDPFLTVSPSDLSFSRNGGSRTVKVSANYPWTASASGTGISVSPSSGEGDATVTISVAGASATSETGGSVTFLSEGLSASVSVKQTIIVVGDVSKIPSDGGTFQIDIQYNNEYTVEIEQPAQSWITFNGTKAMQSGKLEFTFADNGGEERTGLVNIKDKDGKLALATLTFVQEKPAYLALERAALIAFYKANDGDKWINKTNWWSDKPLKDWEGIEMTPDGKHVKSIYMYYNNADGAIPKEIANLTELESLTIINSFCVAEKPSPLPEEIGQLKKLKHLELQNYSISGTLPASLFDLEGLEYLRIPHAEDMDRAQIPSAIGNLVELRTLVLAEMNLTGTLPPEIGNLTKLTVLGLSDNDLTGGIPDSFGGLLNLEKLDIQNNDLGGEIPSNFYRMKNYWRIWPDIIPGNHFTQENIRNAKIPAPESPAIKALSGKTLILEDIFAKNNYTVLFTLAPDSNGPEILPELAALYREKKDEGLEIITFYDNNNSDLSMKSKAEEDFKLILQECGAEWESFVRHMYDDIGPEASPFFAERGLAMYPTSYMDGIVVIGPDGTVDYTSLVDAQNYQKDDLQKALAYIYEVMGKPMAHYSSSSYSEDGKVDILQTASEGKGIDLVITGDGFSDRLIADGTFRKAATQAVADIFSVEPYKSLRNRFNIYLVNAVSKNEDYFNDASTAMSVQFVGATAVRGDIDKALGYAAKAVDESRMDDVVVLVLVNSKRSGGMAQLLQAENDGTYAGGASVAWVPYKEVTVSNGLSRLAGTVIHEVGGHGFGKLADEYVVYAYGKISGSTIQYMESMQKKGFYLNVSSTNVPQKTPWYKFIGDNRYADEEIGLYQGGYSYVSGIWRPTEQSVMRSHDLYYNFNAPSRAQIYTRIMKLSEGQDWEFDYETFVKWDKAHPDTKTKAVRMDISSEENSENTGHVPPVMVGKTWRQVMKK